MASFFQDLRYGWRVLRGNWAFTLIALLTLALGIGANTAIFSVVNGIMLRPLPYPEPERLIILSERSEQLDGMSISYPNFTDWRAQNGTLENLAVFRRQSYNLTERGEPERLIAGQVSATMFSALGVAPASGRTFTEQEDRPGGEPVVVLSHALWQRRFGSDPALVGQTLNLSGKRYTVIGVMPAGFQFPSRVELWVPVGQESGSPGWQQRGNHPGLYGVARLKPGATLDAARSDLDAIARRLEAQYPDSNTGNRVTITSLYETIVRQIRPALLMLIGAVICVLLIACANVANLQLARASARQKEIAIRAALGAGRWRIMRQLLVESLLISMGGAIAGLLVAQWGVDLIIAINPNGIPRVGEIGLDTRVLVFTLAIALVTGLLFGLAPALSASRVDLNETLKDAGRGTSAGRSRQRFRHALVISEVALSLILLVVAGLILKSFYRLQSVDSGFREDRLLTLSVSLPPGKYPGREQIVNFFEEAMGRIRATPGVESVAVSTGLPLGNNGNQTSFRIAGRPEPPPGQAPLAEVVYVSPDYFRTLGMTLVKGRAFNASDRNDAPPVMVVDESFAARYWPGEDAVGQRVNFGGRDSTNPPTTVVGVVRRVRMEGLDNDSNRVQAYFPYLQNTFSSLTLSVRTTTDPLSLAETVRRQILEVDPDQPIHSVRSMEQIRLNSVAPQRLNMLLLAIFAALAVALALVGIYGVIAYSVTQRTHEIGVRLALGAQPRNVLAMIVRQGMTLTAVGVATGLAGAWLATRWMRALLFGVSTFDPLTYGGVTLLLALVALGACYLPARRAARTDPLIALRYE